MSLDPTLETALNKQFVREFYAVQINLANSVANMILGLGTVTFDANGETTTFVNPDPFFGILNSISQLTDSVTTEAPHFQITFSPQTANAIGVLGAVAAQTKPVYVWYGVVDDATGRVLGTPYLVNKGRIDTLRINSGKNTRTCTLEVASGWERLFAANEGERLNLAWHQSVFPGKTGLSQAINAAVVDPIWAAKAQPPVNADITAGFPGSTTTQTGH